ASDLVGAQRRRGPERVDLRAPERLDRVDVPDAGDAGLVEQQRLDRGAAAPPEELAQPPGREAARQRLDPKVTVQRFADTTAPLGHALEGARFNDGHAPELARVGELQRAAVGAV